jgi:superoxide dismutase, Fe-Mn family
MNRKEFIQSIFASSMLMPFSQVFAHKNYLEVFTLAPLPYASDALEPHIDKMTMEIHHGRHHKAYIDNLNKAIAGTALENQDLLTILKDISKHPLSVRNNAGGHWNHTFFWNCMGPKKGGTPTGAIAEVINASFGSFEKMKEEFGKAATGRFGSGWAWLIVQNKKLKISSTPNQENPLMDVAADMGKPVLALDVWEHAYYLKYQNKRADYVAAFWNVVDWDFVNKNYTEAMQ